MYKVYYTSRGRRLQRSIPQQPRSQHSPLHPPVGLQLDSYVHTYPSLVFRFRGSLLSLFVSKSSFLTSSPAPHPFLVSRESVKYPPRWTWASGASPRTSESELVTTPTPLTPQTASRRSPGPWAPPAEMQGRSSPPPTRRCTCSGVPEFRAVAGGSRAPAADPLPRGRLWTAVRLRLSACRQSWVGPAGVPGVRAGVGGVSGLMAAAAAATAAVAA